MTQTTRDYAVQAPRYDTSRGASPSVVAPLLEALAGAPGDQLLDVGGGTGNYALALRDAGFAPVVLDRSPDMATHATEKGIPAAVADATELPVEDHSVDAVAMVSMLHLVNDWRTALNEVRRVLRPNGRLAVMILTADHVREVSWVYDWFPAMRNSELGRRMSLADLLTEVPGARHIPIDFTDLRDGSIAALCRHSAAILDPAWRNQTTFFTRLAREAPVELDYGLTRLRERLDAGDDPAHDPAVTAARDRLGDATVLAWSAP